ncbi:unnamed protein product [Clonostachys rosea]|uniref:AAA+ ATPase domain-containing protein n=1 Tax=Bionectria ochroleuca TaxID=29856 RepID=A0ABY6ULJ1_BIOOC|nr:unnamed protein product [Clonostachys rosea]
MVPSDIAEPQDKKLHPFFTKSTRDSIGTDSTAPPTNLDSPLQADVAASDAENNSNAGSKKRQKQDDTVEGQDGPAPKKPRGRKKKEVMPGQESITSLLVRPRNKDTTVDLTRDILVASDIPTPPSEMPSKTNDDPLPQPPVEEATKDDSATRPKPTLPNTPPKKVLKFNPKTGTFGSPPKPKKIEKPSLVVAIKYGQDEASRVSLGSKITQVLAGTLDVLPKRGRPRRKTKEADPLNQPNDSTPKASHPFFSNKAKQSPADSPKPEAREQPPPRRQTIFMSTPVSPRKPRTQLFPSTKDTPNWGRLGPAATKVPGAKHPEWPSRGMSHIRGDDFSVTRSSKAYSESLPYKKSKGQVVSVTTDESVLGCLTRALDLNLVRTDLPRDDDKFEPAPKELRLPSRVFETGRKLQSRIRRQLLNLTATAVQPESDIDELLCTKTPATHPAITRLYHSLESQLSAYDRSTCENMAWTQKYAPCVAAEVIQANKEVILLKQWLEALEVQSVDTGNADKGGASAKGKSEKPAKKKRKSKLDDFIVESDESEEPDLSELSEDESAWGPAGPGTSKKSMVRGVGKKQHPRLANAVVISGPHGSGKTAAVYAVAKELNFEIFEINSSTRRSGKDILEKVGDMTRNHLVHHHKPESVAEEGQGEGETEDEVAKDLKSGKQGMMTAFFKPKTTSELTKQRNQPKNDRKSNTESKATPKSQRQSLILLEEADVLYEEDKQFWATLLTMIAQSRRPFIITCNDERLIPLESLYLHGIFRFSPPPQTLAVDVCLLIAANEGHALRRSAVEALYTSRNYDLRATITELNYWCQIGVGDRRGGFDWFYLRWPKGSDLDEKGDVIRVISEDTYIKGMGWMCHDLLDISPKSHLEVEEEAIRQCWGSWNVDARDWHTTIGLKACAEPLSEPSTKEDRLSALCAFDDFCSAMSSSDLCAAGALGVGLHMAMDTSLPELSQKTKDDFTLGRPLIEADPLVPFFDLRADISATTSSLARESLRSYATSRRIAAASSALTAVGEAKAVSILESSFTSSAKLLTRLDIAFAFDPIAMSDSGSASLAYLDPSVFDRTMKLIIVDVAPWVRSIVEYDLALLQERKKLSNLLSEGGTKRRMRTTRSALSALEGGERKSTRGDKYFKAAINTGLVLNTGLKSWRLAEKESIKEQETDVQQLPAVAASSPAPNDEDMGSD